MSCGTCHFEGRNDGLTWHLDDQVRQTPSLAGAVSVTAPFTWTSKDLLGLLTVVGLVGVGQALALEADEGSAAL